MFLLGDLMARFDEALEWPDDPFVGDDELVSDWTVPSPDGPAA